MNDSISAVHSPVLDRFLRYVRYDTQSDESSTTFPSTEKQLVLLGDLVFCGSSDSQWRSFEQLCRPIVEAGMPILPVLGNHEYWWTRSRALDRFFSRDGLDILCTIPIELTQAVLGAQVKVNTIRGAKVKLTIPPGTQPGRGFRIKGQGLEKNGQTGDQVVTVKVHIPEKLTTEQEAMFRKISESK